MRHRHRWKGFKLSESDTKGQHLESGNLTMYNRNGGKALAISLAEFGNNNCSAWSSAQRMTLWPQLNVLRGTISCKPTFQNVWIARFLRDIHLTDWNSGQICLNFYCLIENRFLYIKCKEHSIDCTSALMFVLSILRFSRNAIELQTVS